MTDDDAQARQAYMAALPAGIATPDVVETRLGTLEYWDGEGPPCSYVQAPALNWKLMRDCQVAAMALHCHKWDSKAAR